MENNVMNNQSVAGEHGISGYWLKMIAVITMLIDHSAATILERILVQMPSWAPATVDNWEQWYRLESVEWHFQSIVFYSLRDFNIHTAAGSMHSVCLRLL